MPEVPVQGFQAPARRIHVVVQASKNVAASRLDRAAPGVPNCRRGICVTSFSAHVAGRVVSFGPRMDHWAQSESELIRGPLLHAGIPGQGASCSRRNKCMTRSDDGRQRANSPRWFSIFLVIAMPTSASCCSSLPRDVRRTRNLPSCGQCGHGLEISNARSAEDRRRAGVNGWLTESF